MAIVILGGLVTSTPLNLMVLPTLALHFGRFEPRPDADPDSAAPRPAPSGPADGEPESGVGSAPDPR